MSELKTPFRYDYVGSFLRPEELKKARRQFDEGTIGYEELKAVEDKAITELIHKVKSLGYHVITVLYPVMYFPAPSDSPKITGDLVSSAASKIDFVHSRLLMLK